MQTTIYVATHTQQLKYKLSRCYKLCQVNAKQNGHWQGNYVYDDEGADNISSKNQSYCELTALYSLWKNDSSDIKGLTHYRRFFSNIDSANIRSYIKESALCSNLDKFILDEKNIIHYLEQADIIVETPLNPHTVNAFEDLQRFVYLKDINILTKVMMKYPDYYASYCKVLQSTHISYLNMMIARKEIFDSYCSWLFGILSEVEKYIDISTYDVQHKRIFGYMAEVLLNVWILRNDLTAKYCNVLMVVSNYDSRKTVKRIIKKFIPYIVLARNVCRFEGYKYVKGVMRENSCVKCREMYSISLDNIYSNLKNEKDVLNYIKLHMPPPEQKEKLSRTLNVFHRTKIIIGFCDYGNLLSYSASNRRCLVTFIGDCVEEMKQAVKVITELFHNEYTVTYRLITENISAKHWIENEVQGYCFYR